MKRGEIIDGMVEMSNAKEVSKLSLTDVIKYTDDIKKNSSDSVTILSELHEEQKQRERLIKSCELIISKKVAQLSFEMFDVGDKIKLKGWNGYIPPLNCTSTELEITKINNSSIWVKFEGRVGRRSYYNTDDQIPVTINEEKLNISNFKDIIKSYTEDKTLYEEMKKILVRDDKLNGLLDDL